MRPSATLQSRAAERLILLVPEQFSFESERALLRRLGPRLASHVQVLSFTRMAELVFRELGGITGRRMDDATRFLLMSRAIEQTADHLVLYNRASEPGGPSAQSLSMVTEFKQCGIAPNQLEQAAAALDKGMLKRKTENSR